MDNKTHTHQTPPCAKIVIDSTLTTRGWEIERFGNLTLLRYVFIWVVMLCAAVLYVCGPVIILLVCVGHARIARLCTNPIMIASPYMCICVAHNTCNFYIVLTYVHNIYIMLQTRRATFTSTICARRIVLRVYGLHATLTTTVCRRTMRNIQNTTQPNALSFARITYTHTNIQTYS